MKKTLTILFNDETRNQCTHHYDCGMERQEPAVALLNTDYPIRGINQLWKTTVIALLALD